jgi:hypothetical protein
MKLLLIIIGLTGLFLYFIYRFGEFLHDCDESADNANIEKFGSSRENME